MKKKNRIAIRAETSFNESEYAYQNKKYVTWASGYVYMVGRSENDVRYWPGNLLQTSANCLNWRIFVSWHLQRARFEVSADKR